MKGPFTKNEGSAVFLAAIFCLILLASCNKKIDFVPKADLLNLPALTVKDFETVYSDSGKLKLIMSAPLMEQFGTSEAPYYEFKNGIRVVFYDVNSKPEGRVTAKSARFTKQSNLWELHDSVVVYNETNANKLETEVLYWDEPKDLIYSDRFVKITSKDQIVLGTGFESDPKLNKRKISKVSATIYLDPEE
jgi:LPS export ABC transporter protein LptC